MIIKKYKKYIGLCQCKGCLKFYDTIVATSDSSFRFYPAHVCSTHALDLILLPYLENKL